MPNSMQNPITIQPVASARDRKAFVDLAYRLNADDPCWVPPLKMDVHALITPGKNPWFEHGRAQLFLARRGDNVVGRVSAHIDDIALAMPAEQGFGPGTGVWGLFEAEDADVAGALLNAAAAHLKAAGMQRMLGPVSLAMWDEPGLLIDGFDQAPSALMGHNRRIYADWLEPIAGVAVQDLINYRLPIDKGFPDIVNRIVALGERSDRIRIRHVDKSRFEAEANLIIAILNDAWSDNWGFTPWTQGEIDYASKKLKDIVYEDLIRIAEVDGEPVAFMMTIPDLNEVLIRCNGSLWPFNWAKLLLWLRRPRPQLMRVPLMGVAKKLQGSRMASQLAFMLIEYIRRDAVAKYGATHGDFGWVLDSNEPMKSVGEAVGGVVNKRYRIYERAV